MVGGLLQLKEKGAQDLYLTGQPQITFFKTVYRRYTNFSIESIEQLFDNPPRSDITCRIEVDRRGDLIHRIYLEQKIPTNASFIDEGNRVNYGYNFLKEVNLSIGNQLIDSHTSLLNDYCTQLIQANTINGVVLSKYSRFKKYINLRNQICTTHVERFQNKKSSQDFDKAAEDLRLATRHLGMIVGKVDVEELLGSIFNDFCIGK